MAVYADWLIIKIENMIREVKKQDARAIADIYNYYITDTIVTFEEEVVQGGEMSNRIENISSKFPWIVYEKDGAVVGYAYANHWKSRCAYRYSVETTVYLKHGEEGKGIGSLLYQELISRAKDMGCHVLIGGISLPNAGSIALHEKFGFEKIALFKEVGFKFDKWIDVGYWELILDD